MKKITHLSLMVSSLLILFLGMNQLFASNSEEHNLLFFAPNQPDGFVVFDNIGGEPVNSGEVFLACGPNQVEDANISYKLFYAPSDQASESPTNFPEYDFGSTAGDGNGTTAFGFVLGGLDAGVEYNFYLYQYDSENDLFSSPAIATETAFGGSGGNEPDPDPNPSEIVLVQDFEDESTFTFAGFEGLAGATIEAAPIGDNGNSFKLESVSTGNPWQGAEIVQLEDLLDLTTNKTVQVDVYATQAFNLLLKVENGGPNAAASQSYTTPNTWQTLTFSMTESLDNTSVANGVYEKVVFFPNWNDTDSGFAEPSNFTVYIDNINSATNSETTEPVDPDPNPGLSIVQDFEDEASFDYLDFEGLGGATIEAAPVGDNGNSLKLESLASGNPWQGAFVNQFETFLDLTNNKTVQVDVYATQAFNLLIKVEEGGPDAAASQSYTTPNAWQTLTFTMDEALDNTGVANGIYERFVVFPNWGDDNAAFGTPSTFTVYIDNVAAVASSADEGGDPVEPGEPGEIGEESVTVDASSTWLGFANVFNLPSVNSGVFIFASEWGVADLRTDIDTENNTLTLFPNFNTYANNPGDEFWINPTTGEGNKIFEGITFVESTELAGNILEFSGNVESFSISSAYEVTAFIRVFNADFSFNKSVVTELTQTGNFELIYDDVDIENDVTVQYGFAVRGVNANPADEASLGNVVVGPVSLSTTSFDAVDVQVYPNPVTNVLHVQTSKVVSSVELYTISGRLVTKQSDADYIDVSELASGMYLLKVISDNQSITRKIIKK